MLLRNKLLLYFTSLISVTLVVFGFSAYQISYDSTIENEKAVLENLVNIKSKIISSDYKTKNSLEHAINHLLDRPDKNHAWIILDKNKNIVFPQQIKPFFSEAIFHDHLNKLLISNALSGSIETENNMYLWAGTNIQGTDYKLFHFLKPSKKNYEQRFSELASRLIIVALIITWVAIWFALVISTTVTKQIKYHKDAKKELNSANKILIEAKNIADKANQTKSEFLSNMSHELRTPLNAILGFGQLIEITSKEKESIKYAKEIMKGGNHLLTLINEILDLSKIEAGHLDLHLEDCSLNTIVTECIALIKPLTKKHDISITNNIPADVKHIINVDYIRFKQVLLNLLSNAIKYNRDEGNVTINCESRPEHRLRISVTDTGKGLYPDQLDQLFNAFERVGAENTNIEGTGIGLLITKRLLELMGGEIGVTSQPGKGSTFWLELNQSTNSNETPLQTTAIQNNEPAVEKNRSTVSKTILYIEDNAANLRLVENIIHIVTSHTFISAPDATQGLKLIKTQKPDLILLDINLPDMDGYQVMALLQADEKTRNIPVIALSANAMKNDMLKGNTAGFQEYQAKPINVKKLLASINAILG